MGILDDAIRQHLDLKRRHGAEESELKQLEDEAFGPPTRPGEPDFPDRSGDTGEEAAANGGAEGKSAVAGAPPTPQAPGDEAATTLMPGERPVGTEEPPAEETPAAEAPAPPEAPATEPPSEEQPAEETEPPKEAASGFYDQAEHGELDIEDLDLELEEDLDEDFEEEELASAQPTGETPIEHMETVEHPFEDAIEEPPSEEAPVEPPSEEAPVEPPSEEAPVHHDDEGDEAQASTAEPEGDDEADVLEETPEFLRERPEDDELWFEQGEPKDFDF